MGPNNTDEIEVCSLKFVEILGKKLSKDAVIITGFNDNGVQFGKIKNIIILNNKVTLQIEVFDKICFNNFFYAYEVISSDSRNIFLNISEVPRFPPCQYVKIKNVEFVALRYDV